jgi:hypothetical protein
LRNVSATASSLSYGIQDLPADLDRLGVDEAGGGDTGLGFPVAPIIDRSALPIRLWNLIGI